MASRTVVIFSAASSGISTPNSSSKAITSSTMSRLSAPRSSMKLSSSVTLSGSTPRCSTTIFFTRSAVSLMCRFLRARFPVALAAHGCPSKYRSAWPSGHSSLLRWHGWTPAHQRRNRARADHVRQCDRLCEGAAVPPQMAVLPAGQFGDGAERQHLLPPGKRPLVRGLLQGTARPPRLLHSRDDPCVAGADQRPLLPAADAPPVLPLRLRY